MTLDLDKLLKESIEKLDKMSIDEFEDMCIKAGYSPVRKEVTIPFTEEDKQGAFVTIEESRLRRNKDKLKETKL